MNMFSLYKSIKDSLSANNENELTIPNLKKGAKSKKLCEACYEPIKESEINRVKRTKKQTYNFLKSKSLDGKVRCKPCMIEWLEMKIDEFTG